MENGKIVENRKILEKIVKAVKKTVESDIPLYRQEHSLETNNAIAMLRGDYINENLRQFVVGGEIELIPFKRFIWGGRVLIDMKSKITYSILSSASLKSLRKQGMRRLPHYLQSILGIQNSNFTAIPQQLTLAELGEFGPSEFGRATLDKDHSSIMGESAELAKECTHYVVAYSASYDQLHSIELLLLDKALRTVEKRSLNKYIVPNFADLTANSQSEEMVKPEEISGLVNIKPGLKPKIRGDEKQA